jgi:hypothetical protein
MVDDIIAFRNNKDNDLNSDLWYKDALGTDEEIIKGSLITIRAHILRYSPQHKGQGGKGAEGSGQKGSG